MRSVFPAGWDRRSQCVWVAITICLLNGLLSTNRVQADDVEDFRAMIFVGDADGSNLKPLVDFDGYKSQGSPCWSSDGRLIAFDACKPQLGQQFYDGHIILVNADGTKPRDLGLGILPSLSPKGNRVAYCRHPRMGGSPGVYIMEVLDPESFALIDERGWGAEWSPDGTRLAYVRDRNLQLYDVVEGTVTPILDVEGSGISSIAWNFCWSADSARIAFKAATTDNRQVLAIARANRENQIAQIVCEGELGPAVAWRPFQNEILVEQSHEDRPDFQSLFRVNLAKPGELVRMPSKPVDRRMRNASFSLDGKKLAVSVFRREPADE